MIKALKRIAWKLTVIFLRSSDCYNEFNHYCFQFVTIKLALVAHVSKILLTVMIFHERHEIKSFFLLY